MSFYTTLSEKIRNEEAHVVIMGLGYVGLPLAVELAKSGSPVTGLDPDLTRVQQVQSGESPFDYPSSASLEYVSKELNFSATSDPKVLKSADVIIICVPTPLSKTKEPDLTLVQKALAQVAEHQRDGQLVILESTSYPGTTRELAVPALTWERPVGEKVFIAYSPERIDPGNTTYNLSNTPKLVAGVTQNCSKLAQQVYFKISDRVVPVSSPEVAEMAKVLENTFRAVNIGLANEVALISKKLGIDPFEVIDAAATKPFGFMPFYPGPGLGGHCLVGSEWVHVLDQGVSRTCTLAQLVEDMTPITNEEGVVIYRPKELQVLSLGSNGAIYKPVRLVSKRLYTGELVRIQTVAGQHLTVTADHRMMVWRNDQIVQKEACELTAKDSLIVPLGQPEKSMKFEIDLIEGLLGFAESIRVRPVRGHLRDLKLNKALKQSVTVDGDFARLVGYYLSEGCITEETKRLKTRFTFNINETGLIEDVRGILQRIGFRHSEHIDPKSNAHHIQVSSRPFAVLLRDILGCGVDSYDVRIPDGWLSGPLEIRENLLKGLLRGDGSVHHINRPSTYRRNGKDYTHNRNIGTAGYFTSSPVLFQQIIRLLQGLDFTPTFKNNSKELRICGAEPLQRLEAFFEEPRRQRLVAYRLGRRKPMASKQFQKHNGFATTRVKSSKVTKGSEIVYSLEVQGTETFVTSFGLLVHNCIPVDPLYLSWKLRSMHGQARFIELADTINSGMPDHVVQIANEALNSVFRSVRGSKVLVMGVTYKADVSDTRESPVTTIIERLLELGADVRYEDPYVPTHHLSVLGKHVVADHETVASYGDYDLVILAAAHKTFDLTKVLMEAKLIVDTRGVFREGKQTLKNPKIFRI